MSTALFALSWLAFVVHLVLELVLIGVALAVVRPVAPRAGYILSVGAALAASATCGCRIWNRVLLPMVVERGSDLRDTMFVAKTCVSLLEYVLVVALILFGLASLARTPRTVG